MKKTIFVTTVLVLLLLSFYSHAQDNSTTIHPVPLCITYAKTTNLIFPYPITGIDLGSKDILAQKALGVENVLQVKAGTRNFPQTNLTVITADGSFFSYLLDYGSEPTGINIKAEQSLSGPLAIFTKDATNDIIQGNAAKIATRQRIHKREHDVSGGVYFNIKGVYVQEDVLYFQFEAKNLSNLNYDIKMIRFFIKDQKKAKRTASQEIDIEPMYVLGNKDVIRGKSEQVIVFGLPRFTIPDKKCLVIQLMEKDGGRNLQLSIPNKTIVTARAF